MIFLLWLSEQMPPEAGGVGNRGPTYRRPYEPGELGRSRVSVHSWGTRSRTSDETDGRHAPPLPYGAVVGHTAGLARVDFQ